MMVIFPIFDFSKMRSNYVRNKPSGKNLLTRTFPYNIPDKNRFCFKSTIASLNNSNQNKSLGCIKNSTN